MQLCSTSVSAFSEVYGNLSTAADCCIRLSNGGAGPTGVLKDIALRFISAYPTCSVSLTQAISRISLDLMRQDVVNVALVYEPEQINKLEELGCEVNRKLVFYDHFLLVGPRENEARVHNCDSVAHAFEKIGRAGANGCAQFVSRDDLSGTNMKEREIWSMTGLQPWIGEQNWYFKKQVFPKDALILANDIGAYTLTDNGTFLTNLKDTGNLKIFCRGGDLLLNPCFAVSKKSTNACVTQFFDYLNGKGQEIFQDFGRTLGSGKPLFTPAYQKEFKTEDL